MTHEVAIGSALPVDAEREILCAAGLYCGFQSVDLLASASSRWNRLRNGNDGSSVVEFALVLPLLLLITTGILSFGIALNNMLTLTNATSIGARFLAVDRGMNLDPCATSVAIVKGTSPGLNPANLTFTFVINGTTYPGLSCNSSSLTAGAAGNMVQGTAAQVTVTYPCRLGVFGNNILPGCTLKAQTTEQIQ
jgi:Flp pilus assembly protein TadG